MLYVGFDLVADAAVAIELGFFAGTFGCELTCEGWGIFESDMDDLGFAAEPNGTSLVSMTADGDDVIEGDVLDGVGVFRGMARNVDPGFGHDFDGIGIETVRFNAIGIGFDGVAFQCFGPAFSHLASAGVSGAEE